MQRQINKSNWIGVDPSTFISLAEYGAIIRDCDKYPSEYEIITICGDRFGASFIEPAELNWVDWDMIKNVNGMTDKQWGDLTVKFQLVEAVMFHSWPNFVNQPSINNLVMHGAQTDSLRLNDCGRVVESETQAFA